MTTFTIEDHVLYASGQQVQALPRLARPATVTVWSVPVGYVPNGYFVDVREHGEYGSIPACASSEAKQLVILALDADGGAMASDARTDRLTQVNADADALLSHLDASYPDREVLTWDQQLKEAEALQADPAAATPLLTSLASYRDIGIILLAEKVLEKSMLYKVASGQIMGARQWVEQAIEAAVDHQAVLDVPTLAERLRAAQEA